MTDPAATLLSVSTLAPFGKDVLVVLQSATCPVAAYVVAQLAVEVIVTSFSCDVFSSTNYIHSTYAFVIMRWS